MSGPRYSIIPADAVGDSRLSHAALRVLAVLGTHANNNGWCHVRQSLIADRLGISRRYVSEALNALVGQSYVRVIPRFGPNGAQLASLYQVVMDLIEAWRGHYNGVRPHSSLDYRPPAPESFVTHSSGIMPWGRKPAVEGARSPIPTMASDKAVH